METLHFYATDFGRHVFDPSQFKQYMTEAAKKAGSRAFGDMRFRVARAIKAWAAEQDKLLVWKPPMTAEQNRAYLEDRVFTMS